MVSTHNSYIILTQGLCNGLRAYIMIYDTLKTGQVPKSWKYTDVIMILKPSKPEDDPRSYWPISLLCVMFKLTERIISERIKPMAEKAILIIWERFQHNRGCYDQFHALTSYLENGTKILKPAQHLSNFPRPRTPSGNMAYYSKWLG